MPKLTWAPPPTTTFAKHNDFYPYRPCIMAHARSIEVIDLTDEPSQTEASHVGRPAPSTKQVEVIDLTSDNEDGMEDAETESDDEREVWTPEYSTPEPARYLTLDDVIMVDDEYTDDDPTDDDSKSEDGENGDSSQQPDQSSGNLGTPTQPAQKPGKRKDHVPLDPFWKHSKLLTRRDGLLDTKRALRSPL